MRPFWLDEALKAQPSEPSAPLQNETRADVCIVGGGYTGLWTAIMLVMDLVDRRTLWRDYWIEWALAAALILLAETAEWKVAAWSGAPVPFVQVLPSVLISILAFPIFAYLASRIDRWRLGQ